MEKTNVMRLLDANSISYVSHEYDSELTDGEQVAKALGQDPDRVFKTLVTIGNDKHNYVFIIPVNRSLDLKKAAKAVNVKNIEMIKQKELLPLTGYVHGGCSPIGMKKSFETVIDETAQLFDTITLSAGKKGCQIELSPDSLLEFIKGRYIDLVC
jgi:Cys-tRNA(Pro)/Cys-tRNA(Cys) deacylase